MAKWAGKNDGPRSASRFEVRVGENFDKLMDAIDPDNIHIDATKAVNKTKPKLRRKSRRVDPHSGKERAPEQPNVPKGEVSYPKLGLNLESISSSPSQM